MATSINLRLNDELEQRLKEKVEEIKKVTPLGAEINNSTVVRGALTEFFNKIDRENDGERSVKFNFKKLSVKDIEEMDDLLHVIFESMKEFEQKNPKVYAGVWSIMNSINIEVLEELLKRKSENKNNMK